MEKILLTKKDGVFRIEIKDDSDETRLIISAKTKEFFLCLVNSVASEIISDLTDVTIIEIAKRSIKFDHND